MLHLHCHLRAPVHNIIGATIIPQSFQRENIRSPTTAEARGRLAVEDIFWTGLCVLNIRQTLRQGEMNGFFFSFWGLFVRQDEGFGDNDSDDGGGDENVSRDYSDDGDGGDVGGREGGVINQQTPPPCIHKLIYTPANASIQYILRMQPHVIYIQYI